MGDPTKLGLQGQDIHGHQGLVQRVLARKGAGVLRGPHNFLDVTFSIALGREPAKRMVESVRKRSASFDFSVYLQ